MAEPFMLIVGIVLERVSSFLIKEIDSASAVKSELSDFVGTLSAIKAVLVDAETRQATDHNLSDWLGRLRDVCYDAEDVLDEYEYEDLWQKGVNHRSFKRKVVNFFSHSSFEFRIKIAHKLQDVRKRLAAIENDRLKYFSYLKNQDGDRGVVVPMERETDSFVQYSGYIGRNGDRDKIIPDLMSPSDSENVSVIPIVGIGGMGKTTLAKLLYNDVRVAGHFELRMWVYVSENFDVKRLIKDIITSAAVTSSGDSTLDKIVTQGDSNLGHLKGCLRNTLKDKRYLLVLDDVWTDNKGRWTDFKDYLMEGASGSKIIVTTRHESVASILGTIRPYMLEGLFEEECESLFVKWAFREGEENEYPDLQKIGKQIVKKCHGVPLAVRTLGCLLCLKRDPDDWRLVRDSEMWQLEQGQTDLLPILRLSYTHLPSHLKHCFAFCSIFPKGYKFNSLELIRLWIAQGLLYSSGENAKLEDLGRQYIKELLLRSFFQNVKEYGFVLTFEMHDLIHDLASLVAQTSRNYCGSDRHVSMYGDLPKEVTSNLPKQKNVRTIIFPARGAANNSFAKTCISRFKYLRVLDLRDSHFEVLPSSISNLKLLRYLNLFNSSVKRLPSSIGDLLNLQTLELSNCLNLEEVPKDIGNLVNLRCLYVTTRQMFLPEEGIGRLMSLRFLGIIGCCNLKNLVGVKHLTSLQTLLIEDCGSLECLPCSMQGLTALDTLFIYNCEKLNLMAWEKDNGECSLSLRSSWFACLPQLVALPEWLKRADNTLQHLSIGDCHNLVALPDWLQNFTSLRKLVIEDCTKLSVLPKGMMRSLHAQRKLKIENCPRINLDEGTSDEAGTSKPRND